jgi:hypothetical protein
MTHALSLSYGATTVSLTTSGAMLSKYTPTTSANGEPVSEPIELVVYGSTPDAMRAKLRDIQRALTAAERRAQALTGAKVYLNFQPSGDTTTWRSEISGGVLVLDDKALTVFGQAQIKATLIVTRQPYWEGARTQIPLTNPNGANNTSGLTINNGTTNYADIAAASVVGDLPAPLEVRLRNTSGGNRGYYGFHISNNTFAPSVTIHLEGEANTSGYAGTNLTGASGGQIANVTGSNPASIAFNLPAATVNQFAGRWARILVRCTSVFSGGSGPLYGWAQLYDYYGLVTLYRTPMATLRNAVYMQDLGAIPLPPGGSNASGWSQLVLRLWFRGASTSLSAAIDYFVLAPAEQRFYRYFVQRGMLVQNNDWLVDDGIEGAQYLIEAGANHPIYNTVTPPVHVVPNTAQRLYVWQEGQGVTAAWTMQIQAFYRPRIATL